MAGPGAEALARSEAGHHEEAPGAADQLVFAARYGEVLGAEGRFSEEVVQHPHWVAAAADRKEFEIGLGARKGLVHPEQHKGWERLDAAPAC